MPDLKDKIFVIKPNERLSFKIENLSLGTYHIAGDLYGKLDLDSKTKEFIYTPNSDFSGDVDFILSYNEDSSGRMTKNVKIKIQVANTFKPRARLIKIIGQELISNDVIALVELIKNSYDADAKKIKIQLNDILSEYGEIIIKDDGVGMTYEKIINVWLEPATPDKNSKEKLTFSKCFRRRFLGEKGIGRFAVHRLGEKIELITRARIDCAGSLENYETSVIINWEDFTEEKYLSEIPVVVKKITTPKTFPNNSGTIIKISSIHPWKNNRAVTDAAMKIKGLESPVKPSKGNLHDSINNADPGISVEFVSNDDELNNELKETKTLKELLDTAFYQFNGVVDETGSLLYNYSFNRIDYQDLNRTVKSQKENLQTIDVKWFEEHSISKKNTPGLFEVNFYAWDLDSIALKVAGLASYYKNIIKPNAGVRIYRDNFRVWPYGEGDNDWLGLDLIRLNEPKERPVSRNQIFGVIHISSTENKKLKDQSNREGLISNEQYENFYHLVGAALTVFARERKVDKIKIDKISKAKPINDIVTESIENLRNKVEANKHNQFYKYNIDKIENAYNEKINDILERYMMAAAIGISYSIPIHEMKLRLTSITNLISNLEKKPQEQDKFLRQLTQYVNDTQDIITAVTSIMSRQSKKSIKLLTVAENVQILKETDLNKYGIDYEISGDKTIEVEAVPGLLSTALLNLVDNAIYWLRSKKIKSREEGFKFSPKISIKIFRDDSNAAVLQIRDNGEGFEDPFELLIEPYYSRKSDGLGLGLYLVNEIMTRFGGKVIGYNNKGAVIELIFNLSKNGK